MKACLQENMMEECAVYELVHQSTGSETRLLRYCGLLRFVASRVLGGPDEIEEAVERCFHAASRYPVSFEHEGEFRSWLVRVLVDEALQMRSRRMSRSGRDLRRTGRMLANLNSRGRSKVTDGIKVK
jgi:DNA-directed RNA polymerase specialized sigma24 family protein